MKSGKSTLKRAGILDRADRRTRRLLGRFGAAEGGATAVEFSLVALPFFTLLFAIVELGLVFMVSTTLENATDAAARTIRTGQVQGAGGTEQAFKDAICARMAGLGDCEANLSIDVRTYDQFNDISITDPVEDGELDDSEMAFQPGGPEDIVLVRAYYKWKLFTPLLDTSLKNLSDGSRLISSTATFRNEPYEL